MDFSATEEQLEDGTLVVRLSGELDAGVAAIFNDHLLRLIDAGASSLVLDMSGVRFFDSTAIGVLLGIQRRLGASGGGLTVVGLKPNLRKVFEITGVDRVMRVAGPADTAA